MFARHSRSRLFSVLIHLASLILLAALHLSEGLALSAELERVIVLRFSRKVDVKLFHYGRFFPVLNANPGT